MGIIGWIRSLLSVSHRTEIQFHRIHVMTHDDERQVITYITGEIVDQPTVVGSTASLQIPTNTVLIEHDDKRKYTKINGKPYTIFEYTPQPPSEVPDDISVHQIPENLQCEIVPEQELGSDEMGVIRDVLYPGALWFKGDG